MCDKKDWFYHFNLPVRRRKPPGCVTDFELMDWCEPGNRKKPTLIVSYVTKIHSWAASHFCHTLTEVFDLIIIWETRCCRRVIGEAQYHSLWDRSLEEESLA